MSERWRARVEGIVIGVLAAVLAGSLWTAHKVAVVEDRLDDLEEQTEDAP